MIPAKSLYKIKNSFKSIQQLHKNNKKIKTKLSQLMKRLNLSYNLTFYFVLLNLNLINIIILRYTPTSDK